MLDKKLLLPVIMLFACGAVAQTRAVRQTQWIDSLARSEAAWLQGQFQLSAVQTESLHQGYLHAYTFRKQMFTRYWKTDSFPIMIKRADRLKDSIYLSILGPRRFYAYKDTLFRRQERQLRKPSPSPKPTQQ